MEISDSDGPERRAYDVHQCQRPGFFGIIVPPTSATPSRAG
jgi:hypothetical protein